MPCEICKNEDRIRQLEVDSEHNQATHKEFFGRFEKLERENAVTDERYQQILCTMGEVKADVRELKEKPAKRWEQLVTTALQWLVLGLLALTMIFK